MLHTPDPEFAAEGENEVEITDLASLPKTGNISRKFARWSQVSLLRTRTWMSIAMIVGIVLLMVIVLVYVLHVPKAAKVTIQPMHINYPVSLSVVNGICYTNAPNGVVTAFRVRDGALIWRHAGVSKGEESATVVDGVIYLTPMLPPGSPNTTMTIEALRARDGSSLWSRTFPTDSFWTFQLTVANRVVYVMSSAERIDALRASDGSSLWHYISRAQFFSPPVVADGVVYATAQDSHFYALRASDGFPLWSYSLPNPPQPFPAVVADGMVYLSLQDGSMDVLGASTGVLLWRYTPRVPALQLNPQPLVVDGVVFAGTQDSHLYALRASYGFTIWHVALNMTYLQLPDIVTGGVIYVGGYDGSIYALRESDGSVFWRHQGGEAGPASNMVTQGVIYLVFDATSGSGVNLLGSITALRANDGILLWSYTSHTDFSQLLPVEGDDLVLIASQDGSVDALRGSSGSLLWHRAMNS